MQEDDTCATTLRDGFLGLVPTDVFPPRHSLLDCHRTAVRFSMGSENKLFIRENITPGQKDRQPKAGRKQKGKCLQHRALQRR